MKYYLIILASTTLTALMIGSRYYYYSPFYKTIDKAVAVIYPTQGSWVSGTVTFVQEKDGLHITAQIKGLRKGKHGFHIHEYGDCACADATCAGGHFNPTHQPHGSPDQPNRHVGDLGNIIADEQGNATYETMDQQTTLNGPHSIIGRSVIIHEKEDDLVSQPTGNAGARVGCGVIGIAQ